MSAYIEKSDTLSNCCICGVFSREEMYILNSTNKYTYNKKICRECLKGMKESINKLDLK